MRDTSTHHSEHNGLSVTPSETPLRNWNIRFQEWLTIGEAEYRRVLARDQEILLRETSASKWQDFFRTVVAQ